MGLVLASMVGTQILLRLASGGHTSIVEGWPLVDTHLLLGVGVVVVTPIVWRSGGHTPIVWRSGGHTPIVWRSGGHTPIVWRNGGHTPIVWRSGGHTPIVSRSGGHTPCTDETE